MTGSRMVFCPLCGHEEASASWLGSTHYGGREYSYAQCRSCGSLFCRPMPDDATMAEMYGARYEREFLQAEETLDPRGRDHVVGWLGKMQGGTFLDYGCGAGALLVEAAARGWEAVGVEFDEQRAREVARRTGLQVLPAHSRLLEPARADVLHLGDVIEHLPDLDRQLPEVLRLLRPGGVLLAQGPLEANPTLFHLAVRVGRALRRRRTEMAPYHVILATAEGQRRLFHRFDLEQLEYWIWETAWPAPERLSVRDLARPRQVGLFLVSRLSRAISSLRRGRWGNRYFYSGRWKGPGRSSDRTGSDSRARCGPFFSLRAGRGSQPLQRLRLAR